MTDTDIDGLVERLRAVKAVILERVQNERLCTEAADALASLKRELAQKQSSLKTMAGEVLDRNNEIVEWMRRAELSEKELAALDASHQALGQQLADTGNALAVQRAKREEAERERDACHEVWRLYLAKIATVIPDAQHTPMFHNAEAIIAALSASRAEGERLERVLTWLHGAGPDHEGQWFGDTINDSDPPYWWRARAREMRAALSSTPAGADDAGEDGAAVAEDELPSPRVDPLALAGRLAEKKAGHRAFPSLNQEVNIGWLTAVERDCIVAALRCYYAEQLRAPTPSPVEGGGEKLGVDAQSHWSGVGHYFSVPPSPVQQGGDATCYVERSSVRQLFFDYLRNGATVETLLGAIDSLPITTLATPSIDRDKVLEEAARVADQCSYSGTGLWIAAEIRSLKSQPNPASDPD